MVDWLNKKTGKNWRPRSWHLVLGSAAFLLVLVVSIAFATTTTWDFGTPGDYTYDNTKIEVTGGAAKLKKNFTVTHDTQTLFNTGTYTGSQSATGPDRVEITDISGAALGTPVTASYTSVIIDGGISTTTWKTLTHART